MWLAILNSLLASPLVPSRLRTVVYRISGFDLHRSVRFASGTLFRTAAITVGAGSTVNYRCLFDNRARVSIGARVGVGIGVQFVTSNHEYDDPNVRAGLGSVHPIVVGDGVWIGSAVTVLSGVTIGEGCVVAAGSVVVNDCEPHGLYAGTPARRIKDLPR